MDDTESVDIPQEPIDTQNTEQRGDRFLSPDTVNVTPIRTTLPNNGPRQEPLLIPMTPNPNPTPSNVFGSASGSGFPQVPVQHPTASFAPNHFGLFDDSGIRRFPMSHMPALMAPNPVSQSSFGCPLDHISVLNPGEQQSTVTYKSYTKEPPTFDGSEDYRQWRKSLFMWTTVCKVPPNIIAAEIYNCTKGLARSVLDSIPTNVLVDASPHPSQPDQTVGLYTVLKTLDEAFLSTHYSDPHTAIMELWSFRRKQGESWTTYIAEFQTKVREVLKTGHKLDQYFLPYLFLENSCMPDEDRKLVISHLEARGVPFHTTTLDQLLHVVRVLCIQTERRDKIHGEDAFFSGRQRFYRQNSPHGRRSDDTRTYYNDNYWRNDGNRNGRQFQRNYQRNQSPYRRYESNERRGYDDRFTHDNRRTTYDDRNERSNFRGQARGQSSGKGKGKRDSQTDGRLPHERYDNQPNRNRGKSKGKSRRPSQDNRPRNFSKGKGKSRKNGSRPYERARLTEQSGDEWDYNDSQDVLFNAVQSDKSDTSEFGFDCTRAHGSGNDLYLTQRALCTLVDNQLESETIQCRHEDDEWSELSDVDDFYPQISQEDDARTYDVFGVSSMWQGTTVTAPSPHPSSIFDADMNPLEKPCVAKERRSSLNHTTNQLEYVSNKEIREEKERVLSYYVYHTDTGTRRKYIAKGTNSAIGNLSDSPSGVIDTGCSSSVCGINFFKKYESFLHHIGEERSIVRKKSKTKFRFANGEYGTAVMYAELPVMVGTKVFSLGVHVLPTTNTELLVSLPSISRMGMKIDFETHTLSIPKCEIYGFRVPIVNDHMYFPLYWFKSFTGKAFPEYTSLVPRRKDALVSQSVLNTFLGSDEKTRDDFNEIADDDVDLYCLTSIIPTALQTEIDIKDPKFLLKIHTQYAHRSADKMYRMLKHAKEGDLPEGFTLDYLKEILAKCPVCAVLKKKPITPKWGGMMSKEFNSIIAIDLAEMTFRNSKVLLVCHIMDIYSRFSYCEIVPTKEGVHVIDVIMGWICRAGRAPKHLFSDRGAEFCNQLVTEFCASNGTQHLVTSAYSPHSNGLCERRNGVIKNKLEFIVNDMVSEHARFSFSPQYLLNLVVFSVNSQPLDNSGYCPYFIAFLINPVPWMLCNESSPPSKWIDDPTNYHPLIADRMILQLKVSASVYSKSLMSTMVKAWKSKIYQKRAYDQGERVCFWKRDARYPKGGYYLGPATVVRLAGNKYELKYADKLHLVDPQAIVLKDQFFPSDYYKLFDAKNPLPQMDESQDDEPDEPPIVEEIPPEPADPEQQAPLPAQPPSQPIDASSSPRLQTEVITTIRPSVTHRAPTPKNAPTRRTTGNAPSSASTPLSTPSTRTRRANPLLSQPVTPSTPAKPPTAERPDHSSNSPYSPTHARRLVFGLPDDYVTPDIQTHSIFGRPSQVKFNLKPEVKEFEVEDAALCTVVDHHQLRMQDSVCDPRLTTVLSEYAFLRDVSKHVTELSADQIASLLEDFQRTSTVCTDPNCHAIERIDNWYERFVDHILEVQEQPEQTGISAYREPTKDELKMYRKEFDESKMKEINSWIDNQVFHVLENYEYKEGDNLLTSRLLQNIKTHQDGSLAKAKSRIVVRGFQDTQIDILRKDSPTASRISIRLLLDYAITHGFDIFSADVSTAFLQGEKYSKDDHRSPIYVRPPRGINQMIGVSDNAVWVLDKSAYGLVDAPKRWYLALLKCIVTAGMKRSLTDFALFSYRVDGNIEGVLVSHVDDLLYTGTTRFHQDVIARIQDKFKFGKVSQNRFQYCGSIIELDKAEKRIRITQEHYAQGITLPKLSVKRPSEDFLDKQDFDAFRSALGQLNWLVVMTRPDLSLGTNLLAQIMQNPSYADYSKLLKLVKTARLYAHIGLEFVPLGRDSQRYIVAFSDASHANQRNEGKYTSQTGTLLYLATLDENDMWTANLIDWSSKKQKRIVRSTLAAECLGACDTLDRAISLRDTYANLHGESLPILLVVDCKSLETTASMSTTVTEKRLQIDIGSIRELVERGEVQIIHVPTGDMIADCLTKPMQLQALHDSMISHKLPHTVRIAQ